MSNEKDEKLTPAGLRKDLWQIAVAMVIEGLLVGFIAGATLERAPAVIIHLDWFVYSCLLLTLIAIAFMLRNFRNTLKLVVPDSTEAP